MTKAKNQTKENQVTKSIIDVVVNGMTCTQVAKEVTSRIEKVEKSVFNIALLSAYGTGVTIPQYTDNKGVTHAEATCENHMKQKDFIIKVGRSKQAISRWIIAMELIIENKYFTDFANGVYPFSYDKIITIFRNKEVFKGRDLKELMLQSAHSLEIEAKDFEKTTEEKTVETTEEEVTSTNKETSSVGEVETTEEVEEEIEVTCNGITYITTKSNLEKFLANCRVK